MTSRTFAHNIFLAAVFSALALALIGCQAEPSPAPVSLMPTPEFQQSAPEQPTPTPSPVPTVTPYPTPVPTATPVPEPTPTPAPTATSTPPPTPAPTATPAPPPTPAPAPTATPTPAPTPTPTATPTPEKLDVLDYVKWEIGSEVSLEDQQNAKYAVQLMHDYMVSLGMPKIEEDITVHLYHNHDAMAAALARLTGWTIEKSRDHLGPDGSAGLGGEGWAFANISSRWIQGSPEERLFRLVSGEFELALKNDWSELRLSSGSNEVPEAGPRWLGSGIDYFLQRHAMSEAGRDTYDAYREEIISGVQGVYAPLSTMETRKGFLAAGQNPYRYSALAAELLASYTGPRSLVHYYTSLKHGTTWQKEFQNTFGMSVDEFYELFEEHHAAGFPEVDVSK